MFQLPTKRVPRDFYDLDEDQLGVDAAFIRMGVIHSASEVE